MRTGTPRLRALASSSSSSASGRTRSAASAQAAASRGVRYADLAPAVLHQRAGTPDEHALQIVVMENRQERRERARIEGDDQARQDQRQGCQRPSPGEAEHEQRRQRAAGKRDALAARGEHCRREQGGCRQSELGAGRHAQRRRLGQRIAQHLLQQRPRQTERGAGQEADQQARQEAVDDQDLGKVGGCRVARSPLATRQRQQPRAGWMGSVRMPARARAPTSRPDGQQPPCHSSIAGASPRAHGT